MSKLLNKQVAAFNYVDKTLLLLLATSGSCSTAFFATVLGAYFNKYIPCIGVCFEVPGLRRNF